MNLRHGLLTLRPTTAPPKTQAAPFKHSVQNSGQTLAFEMEELPALEIFHYLHKSPGPELGTAMTESSRIAVYTVIMGDGYALPKAKHRSDADHLCFTDQSNIDPNGWTIIKCSPTIPDDLPRSSREQKIRPHRHLQNYQRSIYIDPSVSLMSSAEDAWHYLMPNESTIFGCFWHSYRETLSDEFSAVEKAEIEHVHILSELREFVSANQAGLLGQRPMWGGFLARRHMMPGCIESMEHWFAYVLRYSRRDQLTLPLALSGLPTSRLSIRQENIFRSPVHTWPIEGYKRPERYYAGYRSLTAASEMSRQNKRSQRLVAAIGARLGLKLTQR